MHSATILPLFPDSEKKSIFLQKPSFIHSKANSRTYEGNATVSLVFYDKFATIL